MTVHDRQLRGAPQHGRQQHGREDQRAERGQRTTSRLAPEEHPGDEQRHDDHPELGQRSGHGGEGEHPGIILYPLPECPGLA